MPWVRRAIGLAAVLSLVAGCGAPERRDDTGDTGGGTGTACQPNKQIDCTCNDGSGGKATCSADGSRLGVCECAPVQACVPLTPEACTCQNGASGVRTCNPDGLSWSACQCGAPAVCEPQTTQACTCGNGASGQQTCNPDGSAWGTCACGGGSTCSAMQLSAAGTVTTNKGTIDFTGALLSNVTAAHAGGLGCLRAFHVELSRGGGCALTLGFSELSPGFGGLTSVSLSADASCPAISSAARGTYAMTAGYGLLWPTLQPESLGEAQTACLPSARVTFPSRTITLTRADGDSITVNLAGLSLAGKFFSQADGGSTCPSASACTGGYDAAGSWCVPHVGCGANSHDGGDGACVPRGQCSAGYHDGGDGTCVDQSTCSSGYVLFVGMCVPNAGGTSCSQAPTSAAAGADQTVRPNTVVTVDASSSSSPRGGALSYAWRFTQLPSGTTSPVLSGSGARRSFTPTVVGDYALEVTVNDGTCPATDAVVIHVSNTTTSSHTVSAQLTWRSGQASGDGGDLDLHYLGPNGTFMDVPDTFGAGGASDACYANTNPDWGLNGTTKADGVRSDDPSVGADDSWGFGPESVTHPGIFNGTFTVVVHDWCSRPSLGNGNYGTSVGPVTATVTVFVDGAQRLQVQQQMNQRDVWKAAQITVSGGQISVSALSEPIGISSWNTANPLDQNNQSCTADRN